MNDSFWWAFAVGAVVIFILEKIREHLRDAVQELAAIRIAINGPRYSTNNPLSERLEGLSKDVSAISEGVEHIRLTLKDAAIVTIGR